jgi:hypothetical protein
MKKFDSLVVLGDSWSWGSELPEDIRVASRFDTLLGNQLGLECINLSRESASNFCLKWHWLDWISTAPAYKNPLVIVGITGPNRWLIYNNQAEFFQEGGGGRLVNEDVVMSNWGNSQKTGGFIRAFPNYIDTPTPEKTRCQENFYRYNYNDTMAEIYAIWEINQINSMVQSFGGQAIFWSNFHKYTQVNMPWCQPLLKTIHLVDDLQPIATLLRAERNMLCRGGHPNADGHKYIHHRLLQYIASVVGKQHP